MTDPKKVGSGQTNFKSLN